MVILHYCNWFNTKLQFSSHMTSSMYKHNMLHTKLSTEFDRFTLNIWKHQNVFRSMTSSFCRFLKMENTQNQCLFHETKNKKDDWAMIIIWRKRFFSSLCCWSVINYKLNLLFHCNAKWKMKNCNNVRIFLACIHGLIQYNVINIMRIGLQ